MDWLIATDLDGTLLDDAYRYDEAAAACDALVAEFGDCAIVLASSKTLAEMLALARHATHPPMLIFENGAGFALPKLSGGADEDLYRLTLLGASYAQICTVLFELGLDEEFRFRGFHQMSRAEVAEATGLDLAGAALARRRLASEPIRWLGPPAALPRFAEQLALRGLKLQRGGRFHHVTADVDKRRTLGLLLGELADDYGIAPRVIACGDAPNDLPLLDCAEHGLLFPQRDGSYLREEDGRISHARGAGPAEWLAGLRRILSSETA